MNQFSAHTDAQLWDAICQGDAPAFDELVIRYWKLLFNEAYKRVPVEEVCKDLVQEVFAHIWKKRESLMIENHEAYLRTAIRYRVYTYYSRNQFTTTFLEPFECLADPSSHADHQLDYTDLRKLIRAWIDTLPAKRRQIFILYLEKQLSTKEIATELNISQKTVQNQLNRSMGELRSRLTRIQFLYFLFL